MPDIIVTGSRNADPYGCARGALASPKFGVQPSLPTREEVENNIL